MGAEEKHLEYCIHALYVMQHVTLTFQPWWDITTSNGLGVVIKWVLLGMPASHYRVLLSVAAALFLFWLPARVTWKTGDASSEISVTESVGDLLDVSSPSFALVQPKLLYTCGEWNNNNNSNTRSLCFTLSLSLTLSLSFHHSVLQMKRKKSSLKKWPPDFHHFWAAKISFRDSQSSNFKSWILEEKEVIAYPFSSACLRHALYLPITAFCN